MANTEVATNEGPSVQLSGRTAVLKGEAQVMTLTAAALMIAEGVAIAQQVPAGEIPSSVAVQQQEIPSSAKEEKEDQSEDDGDSDDDLPPCPKWNPRGKLVPNVVGDQDEKAKKKEKEKKEKEKKEKEEKEEREREKRERDAKGKTARMSSSAPLLDEATLAS